MFEEHPSLTREERFADLAHRVGPALRRYVVRRVPDAAVDDVVADAFLVLWRRLDDVPADDPLPWCYAVARGCVANQRRSARRQAGLVERLAAHHRGPEQLADHPDLAHALSTLGEVDREVVLLWAWEGLAPREIAERRTTTGRPGPVPRPTRGSTTWWRPP